MIKFCTTGIFLLATLTVCAQINTVKAKSQRLKGENIDGYAVELEGKKSDVTSSLTKYLKDIGKIKFLSSDPIVMTDPVFNGTVYPKHSIYAFSIEDGRLATAWLGINPTEWDTKDVDFINAQLQRMLGEFSIRFQRERMQAQIDETQQAADAVEKQTFRFINQGKDLANKLVNNDLEKIKLEKAIVTNQQDNVSLKLRIEDNKKAQDSIANVAIQIQKVKEAQLEKLRKIN